MIVVVVIVVLFGFLFIILLYHCSSFKEVSTVTHAKACREELMQTPRRGAAYWLGS